MKKWLAFFFLLIQGYALNATPFEVEINAFEGANTFQLPDKIKNTQLQDARNLKSDESLGLTRREGVAIEGSTYSFPAARVWSFTDSDNNEWAVKLDTAGYLVAGKAFTSSNSSFTVALATLSNTQDSDAAVGLGKIWFTNKSDGLTSWDGTSFTRYPLAPFAAQVEIFRNRVALGDISNEVSSVRASGELDGTDWNNDSRYSTSPVTFRIGGVNDGNKIYFISHGVDELIIGKAFSAWALYGNDQRDFRVRNIVQNIGCIYPTSVAQVGIKTYFISNRTLEEYSPPYTLTPVGYPVHDLIDPLSSAVPVGKSDIVTGSDWGLGASSPSFNISTTQTSGAITPETEVFTSSPSWTGSTTTNNSHFWTREIAGSLSLTANVGADATSSTYVSPIFDTKASSPVFELLTLTYLTSGSISTALSVDDSTASDCCLDEYIILISTLPESTEVTLTTSAPLTQFKSRYIRYKFITWGSPVGTAKSIYYKDVTFGSYATGYFQTGITDAGTDITSWGLFTADRTLDDGNVTFQVQSSTTLIFPEAGWVSQALNTTIGVAVRQYIASRVLFTTFASTSNPVVNSLTFNWNNGEAPPDPIGLGYKDRYHLFLTTNTGSTQLNQYGLVFNRDRNFDINRGLNISGAALYSNTALLGDANPTGRLFSLDLSTDDTDARTAIESNFTLKRLDCGQPDSLKTFEKLYMTVSRENTDKSQIFKLTYTIDASSENTLGYIEITTGTKITNGKLSFPQGQLVQGKFIDITVDEITKGAIYSVHRIKLYGDYLDEE